MTPHQTLATTVRLFAIWLFLYYISTTLGTYLQLRKHSPNDTLLPLFIGFGSTLIVCGLVWYFPIVIAKKILPNTVAPKAPKQTCLMVGFLLALALSVCGFLQKHYQHWLATLPVTISGKNCILKVMFKTQTGR